MNDDKIENNWECISESYIGTLDKLKVEGGYLYHTYHKLTHTTTMCFVPDVDLLRYQAHLRDAYNKGFADGQEEAKAHAGDWKKIMGDSEEILKNRV